MTYYVAVGTSEGGTEVTGEWIDMGIIESGTIPNLNMPVTADSGNHYYLSVKAVNGAGLESEVASSLKIKMLNANKPGVVFDGRDPEEDWYAQFVTSEVAVTFSGFESELCGIVGYKWGVSNEPGNSDLLAYTSDGIGVISEVHRVAAALLEVPENTKVYVDVVAITGHGCHESMIVSSSNGIWADVQKPHVGLTMFGPVTATVEQGELALDVNFYQNYDDTIPVKYFVTDEESGYMESTWMVGSGPREADIHAGETVVLPTAVPLGEITLEDKDTLWLTVIACDYVPNCHTYVSAPLTIDTTPPIVEGFRCRQYLSFRRLVLTCSWDYNKDDESGVKGSLITVGRSPQDVSA